MKETTQGYILIVFAFVTIGVAVLLPFILVDSAKEEKKETYLLSIKEGEALLTIRDGNFTAKIYGPDITEYSSTDINEVYQWAIDHTKTTKENQP